MITLSFDQSSSLSISLRAVDNSLSEALRPATCSQDPGILMNKQTFCNKSAPNRSREQVAGRRNMKCQQTLDFGHFYKIDQQPVFSSDIEAIQFGFSIYNRSELLHFVRNKGLFKVVFKNGHNRV